MTTFAIFLIIFGVAASLHGFLQLTNKKYLGWNNKAFSNKQEDEAFFGKKGLKIFTTTWSIRYLLTGLMFAGLGILILFEGHG